VSRGNGNYFVILAGSGEYFSRLVAQCGRIEPRFN